MNDINLTFENIGYSFPLVFVQGTGNKHYLFGQENDLLKISIKDFFISRFPVTQMLWKQIMGNNPAQFVGDQKPVENVSYHDIVEEQGFLKKIHVKCRDEVSKQLGRSDSFIFRLPAETEWEYAARGGIHWGEYFVFSGSNSMDEVGWYRDNSGNESKIVGQKKPNQLGLHDMSGNSWEWCLDYFHQDTNNIPRDGSPCLETSTERVLRGGCYHNFAMHCTVMKRYAIIPDHKDSCIGFRLVLSI